MTIVPMVMPMFLSSYRPYHDTGYGLVPRDTNAAKNAASLERVAKAMEEANANAGKPHATLLPCVCPKCPGTEAVVKYLAAYSRSVDKEMLEYDRDLVRRREEERRLEKIKYDADLQEWEALPRRKRKKTQKPSRPGRLYSLGMHMPHFPNERWYLEEMWDVEHLLVTCNACGFQWREGVK